MDLKTIPDLNKFAEATENKIEAIEAQAAKMGDVEKALEDNENMKKELDMTKKTLAEVKETLKERFAIKSADEKQYNIGKFLVATKNGDINSIYEAGGKLSVNDSNEGFKSKAAPDLGTPLRGDAVTGSYLVPEAWASEILRIPTDPSAVMGKVRHVPMNVRKINFPKASDVVAFTAVTNEITAKTEDNPTFSEVELECETFAAWIAYTEELDEDSVVGLGSYFAELFREAYLTTFDTQVLVANAAPFTGIIRNSSVNSVSMGAGNVSFDDATLDDLIDLVAGLTTQAKRSGAMFIMNPTILDNFKKIKDDNGNYIYAQPGLAQPGQLWGYPVLTSDVMPANSDSAVSTPFIAFGNPKHLLWGDRVGLEIKSFNDTSDNMVYDRLFIRARIRQAFVAANPEAFSVLSTPAS